MQTIWVAFGNLLSFGFAIVSSAVLSRYLSIEEYGLYKQIIFIYSTLLIVFTLGIPRAYSYFLVNVPLEEGKHVANKITNLLFIMGLSMSCCLYFGSEIIGKIMNSPCLPYQLRIFSIVPALMMPTMGIENILITYKLSFYNTLFVVLSKVFLLISIVIPVLTIKADCTMANLGFVVGSAAICLLSIILSQLPYKNINSRKNHTVGYKTIFKFSIPLFLAGIFAIMLQSVDSFFISRYFGTEVFAYYSNGAMELPFVSMITGATAAVLLPYFSKELKKHDTQEVQRVLSNTISQSAKIIYPLVVFCWFFAYPIMDILYGVQYHQSAIYFRITSIINLFNVMVFAPLIIASGKVSRYAAVNFISTVIAYTLIYFMIQSGIDSEGVNWCSLICKVFNCILMFILIKKILNVRFTKFIPLRNLLVLLISSVLTGIFTYGFINIIRLDSPFVILLTGLFIYFSIYLVIAFRYLDYKNLLTAIIHNK